MLKPCWIFVLTISNLKAKIKTWASRARASAIPSRRCLSRGPADLRRPWQSPQRRRPRKLACGRGRKRQGSAMCLAPLGRPLYSASLPTYRSDLTLFFGGGWSLFVGGSAQPPDLSQQIHEILPDIGHLSRTRVRYLL